MKKERGLALLACAALAALMLLRFRWEYAAALAAAMVLAPGLKLLLEAVLGLIL